MSEIQDFVTELQRRAKCPFARWHKIDLHNHSPSSHDYRGPKDLAEAAAASCARAREAGLDVIMFTDHERRGGKSGLPRFSRTLWLSALLAPAY